MAWYSLLNSFVFSLLLLSAPAVLPQTAGTSLTFENNFGETWVMDVVANTPTALHLEGLVYESDGTPAETGMAILLKPTSTLSFTKGNFIDVVEWTGQRGRGVSRAIGGSPEVCWYRRVPGTAEQHGDGRRHLIERWPDSRTRGDPRNATRLRAGIESQAFTSRARFP
jgi:hypothetical protein